MSVDLDVILAAHGAGDRSPANTFVRECAQALAATLAGARVTAGFIRGQPSFAESLRRADRPQRVVVPLLASDGYYAARLRQEAVLVAGDGNAPVVLPPVGTHPALIGELVMRVESAIGRLALDRDRIAVVVLGHGTERHPASGGSAAAVAARIARRSDVRTCAAYLDQSPTVEAVMAGLSAAHVIVVPWLFGGGSHATDDIPARVTAAVDDAATGSIARRITYLEPIWDLRGMPDVLTAVIRSAPGASAAHAPKSQAKELT